MERRTGDAILAVSDCAFRRLLLKSVFERHRCLVVLASTVAQAGDVLAVLAPDAIVADVELTPPPAFVSAGLAERFLGRAAASRQGEAAASALASLFPPPGATRRATKMLAAGFRLYLPDPLDLPLLRRVVERLAELDDEPVLAALLRR